METRGTLRAIKQGDYTKAILKVEVNQRFFRHAIC
jgi:hypothetical protein